MDKSLEEQKVEKKIGQLQNQQKILLNRKLQEERLIERGAILEAVFPPVADMEGEEVKAFLDCPVLPAGGLLRSLSAVEAAPPNPCTPAGK